ncbi:hypothetical protein Dimus_022365 [Dionaea muscipula]
MAKVEGEQPEQGAEYSKAAGSESVEKFYDAEDGGRATTKDAPALLDEKKKEKNKIRIVDPPGISNSEFLQLLAEMDCGFKANARFHELLQQIKLKPPALN